jgi:hypothetical protein
VTGRKNQPLSQELPCSRFRRSATLTSPHSRAAGDSNDHRRPGPPLRARHAGDTLAERARPQHRQGPVLHVRADDRRHGRHRRGPGRDRAAGVGRRPQRLRLRGLRRLPRTLRNHGAARPLRARQPRDPGDLAAAARHARNTHELALEHPRGAIPARSHSPRFSRTATSAGSSRPAPGSKSRSSC